MVFVFNDPATTEIAPLSLRDALPIFAGRPAAGARRHRHGAVADLVKPCGGADRPGLGAADLEAVVRSEEHTSELQSRQYLVCRLLLEKKKNIVSNTLLVSSICQAQVH